MREFGSEYFSLPLSDTYFNTIGSRFADSMLLRSGRDALGYVSRQIVSPKKCILFPAYCCESMTYPFSRNGWEIHYYALKFDLTARRDALLTAVNRYSPDVILFMNYFGISDTAPAINEIKKLCPDIRLIEDFTHCLLDMDEIYNDQVDYYVASIRKWLGINDGAVVLSKHVLRNKPIYKDNDFVKIRGEAQALKRHYLTTGNVEEKEAYRKALNRAEQSLYDDCRYYSISVNSLEMLHSLNIEDIRFKRRFNYFHLLDLLKGQKSITFPMGVMGVHTPFSLPVMVFDRDSVQAELAQNNLYAPVLWPLDEAARKVCPVSVRMADRMLSLPIDQRYDFNDIEDMYKIIRSVLA